MAGAADHLEVYFMTKNESSLRPLPCWFNKGIQPFKDAIKLVAIPECNNFDY